MQLKYQKETVKGLVKELEQQRRKLVDGDRKLKDKLLRTEF